MFSIVEDSTDNVTFTHGDSSAILAHNLCRSSTYRDLNVQLKLSAPSCVYVVVYSLQKVWKKFGKNFIKEETSLNLSTHD